jgi:CheY-like chemotaxis protein
LQRLEQLSAEASALALVAARKGLDIEQLAAARKDVLRQIVERSSREIQNPQEESLRQADLRSPAPYAMIEATRAAPKADDSPRQSEDLLIIVEDEPDDSLLLKRALQQARVDAQTHWTNCGSEALGVLGQMGPQVRRVCVVSDIFLRGEDGFDFLRSVRALNLSKPVIFAFLTGRADRAIEERAYASGADAFFVKPVMFADLIQVASALRELLSSNGQMKPGVDGKHFLRRL